MFVPVTQFRLSLICQDKEPTLSAESHNGLHSDTIGYKRLTLTNALAYYDAWLITAVESFSVLALECKYFFWSQNSIFDMFVTSASAADCGLCYKPFMILIWWSSWVTPVLQMSHSPTLTGKSQLMSSIMIVSDAPNCVVTHGNCRGIIYDRNIFIIPATGLSLLLLLLLLLLPLSLLLMFVYPVS